MNRIKSSKIQGILSQRNYAQNDPKEFGLNTQKYSHFKSEKCNDYEEIETKIYVFLNLP